MLSTGIVLPNQLHHCNHRHVLYLLLQFCFVVVFFLWVTRYSCRMAAIPAENPHLCRLQQVSTIAVRKRIITWMVQDETANGFPGLYIRTVSAFLEHFRAQRSANLIRASRWWAQHQQYCNEGDENVISPPISCSRSQLGNQK